MKKTTLCYIEKDEKYLMLYRNKKTNDVNKGKWIGVGGHQIKNESIEECLLREVKEETGFTLLSYKLRGIISFIIDDIKEKCYVYTSNEFEGELIDCDEGQLNWVNKKDVLSLSLWEGDYLMFNRINDCDFFKIKFVYKNNKLVSYEVK